MREDEARMRKNETALRKVHEGLLEGARPGVGLLSWIPARAGMTEGPVRGVCPWSAIPLGGVLQTRIVHAFGDVKV